MNNTSHSPDKKNNSNSYSKKYIPFFYFSIIRKIKYFRYTSPKITDKDTNDYKKETLNELIRANKIQNRIAILTLIIVCVYIAIGIFQHNQTGQSLILADSAIRQNRENMEFTKRNSDSTDGLNRKSIQIADSALKISKYNSEFTKKELRAYVSFSEINLLYYIPDSIIKYCINIINNGKTPAYNITYWNSMYWCPKGQSNFITQEQIIIDSKHFINTSSNIGSGQMMQFEIPIKLIKGRFPDKIDIENMTTVLNFIGRFTYDDVFGNRHFSQYYIKFDAKTKGFGLNEKNNIAN